MARLDFVVAGPPEAGGSLLAAALAGHPQVRLGDAIPSWPAYTAGGLAAAAGRKHGELAPYLLADFAAQRRLHECVAYPRLLVALRDPVDRAYAAWRRARTAGAEPLADFGAALAAEPSRAAAGCDWTWRYAELGRYGHQFRRLFTLYSPSQVLIVRYPDLGRSPAAVRDQAFSFLGLRPYRAPAGENDGAADQLRPAEPRVAAHGASTRAAAPTGTAADDGAPPDVRAETVTLFRDEILLLEELTRRPFAAWLTTGAPAAGGGG
jgi:hypothetical protein